MGVLRGRGGHRLCLLLALYVGSANLQLCLYPLMVSFLHVSLETITESLADGQEPGVNNLLEHMYLDPYRIAQYTRFL